MFFSAMTKNLNWEISTKNLITFKRWDGLNDRYYWSSLKNPIFGFLGRVFVGGVGWVVHEKKI